MLDIAWPELLVIGAVALVAIGPKDLPKVMRKLGQWAGKARAVVRELQNGFEQLSYEAEINERIKSQTSVPLDPSPEPNKPSTTELSDRERSGTT